MKLQVLNIWLLQKLMLLDIDLEIVEQFEQLILCTDSLLLYKFGWNCVSVFECFSSGDLVESQKLGNFLVL